MTNGLTNRTEEPNQFVKMSYHRQTLRIIFILFSLTIDNVINLEIANQRRSGLYVDNGSDQTVIHTLTTEEEKLALEHEILKLFGLPEKPRNLNGTAPSRKRSAPKFLLDVYQTITDNGLDQKRNKSQISSEFHLTGQDLQTIDQSDVIITFAAHQNHQGAGGKPDRVKRTWFDVEGLPSDVQMISAELRLYRGPEAKNRKHRGAFTITVFRVLRTKDGEREMQHVDSANTTAGHEGWITLNVTESLQHWLKHPGENKGFYLSVHPIDRSTHETRPEDIGIVGFKGDAERQPFMAGFFRSLEPNRPRLIQPSIGAMNDINKRNQKRYSELLRDPYTDRVARNSTRLCEIQNLHVSFKDLQWQDWIIAPEGYDAYYCDGQCKFPLNTHMINATNHAIIQSLVNLMNPQKVPKPCCAPTKLAEISIIYFMDENKVIHTKYRNMVVRGCGCQ